MVGKQQSTRQKARDLSCHMLPVLVEVQSCSGVIEPLNCFQAWDLTDFYTKRASDKTNVCFDLGLT